MSGTDQKKQLEPNVYKKSDLTYNDYLKVPELLKLQLPLAQPAHNDELLFIIIHQAYELWFKLVLNELENAISHMQAKEVLRAHHFVKRVVEIMKVMVQQIHILETMTPAEFLAFRDHLMPASGFQSLQFREIEFISGLKDEKYFMFFQNRPEMLAQLNLRLAAPDLRSAYYDMLRSMGFAIPEKASDKERAQDGAAQEAVLQAVLPIYQKPQDNLPLYLLTESLVDFDACLIHWRQHHVRVVERIIGYKKGTGGSSGVDYLTATTTKKCFPLLWEVRTRLEKVRD